MADLIIAGERIAADQQGEVRSPFDDSLIDEVGLAEPAHVEKALVAADRAARDLRGRTGYERSQWLKRASELLRTRVEDFARTITAEEGKTLTEARAEVHRAAETLELSAEEAKRIAGRGVPIDGASNGAGRLGFTVRTPCGVVVAITPFNFPLNLVVHKLGPALAAGNAVILKPASATPLTAVALIELLLEAGVPPPALSCLVGSGASVGDSLCTDPRVRKISFTGSVTVGEHICKTAGIKRVTMELGGNAPLIVLDDADLDQAVEAAVASGFSNAGQTCISTQRIFADQKIIGSLLDALGPAVAAVKVGDPTDESTRMGPMVRAAEADRVGRWVQEAVDAGATVFSGGDRSGAVHQPTVLVDVQPGMKVVDEEVFGPVIGVSRFDNLLGVFERERQSRFGLSASIFTRDIGRALAFIKEIDAGNLHINGGPGFRADLMPYGGLKFSGFGKEGPAHAILEMTEEKTVVFHPIADR